MHQSLAKVLDVAVLGDRCTHPDGFDLAHHWRSELERFEAGLLQGQATLRVSSAALQRIEVLAPPELRAELARRAGRVLAFYNRNGSDEAEVPTAYS